MLHERVFDQLRGKGDKFEVFRRKDAPSTLHYDSNARSGDPVVVAELDLITFGLTHQTASKSKRRVFMVSILTICKRCWPSFVRKDQIFGRRPLSICLKTSTSILLIAAILGLRIGPIDGGLSIVGRVIQPHS